MFRLWNMAVFKNWMYYIDQLHVIQSGDAPTVRQIQRRDGRVGTITLVRDSRSRRSR